MKTLALHLLISLCVNYNGISQNRMANWDLEKITSIQVEIKAGNGKIDRKVFDEKQRIEEIMNFLKEVDFKEFTDSDARDFDSAEWKYKIVFTGHRDQVYLFKNYAFIGKTTFFINKDVIKDFRKLIK